MKLAVGEAVDDPSSGPPVIVVSGGVASIENCLNLSKVFPAPSVTRTAKAYLPPPRPVTEWDAGPEQAPNTGGAPLCPTLHWSEATPLVWSLALRVQVWVEPGPKVCSSGPPTVTSGAVLSIVIETLSAALNRPEESTARAETV